MDQRAEHAAREQSRVQEQCSQLRKENATYQEMFSSRDTAVPVLEVGKVKEQQLASLLDQTRNRVQRAEAEIVGLKLDNERITRQKATLAEDNEKLRAQQAKDREANLALQDRVTQKEAAVEKLNDYFYLEEEGKRLKAEAEVSRKRVAALEKEA